MFAGLMKDYGGYQGVSVQASGEEGGKSLHLLGRSRRSLYQSHYRGGPAAVEM